MRLLLLIPFILFFVKGKAQDTIQYLDTIVHLDDTKEAIHILNRDDQLIEYYKEGDASTHYITFNKIGYLKTKDNTIYYPSKSSENKIEKSKIPRAFHTDSIKFLKSIQLNTNLLGFFKGSISPYWNPSLNIGCSYFPLNNISIGGNLYYQPNFMSDYGWVNIKGGYELNLGYTTSFQSPFDIGLRIGLIYTNLVQERYHITSTDQYNQIDNGTTPVNHNGSDYYLINDDFEYTFYDDKFPSWCPYFLFELNIKLTNVTSMYLGLGGMYYRDLQFWFDREHSYTQINQYLDPNGYLIDETITVQDNSDLNYSDYAYEKYFLAQFGFRFKIKTLDR